ncbi:MAG TPA: L17 family ribosomal protein, partial [Solirubrobacterales bacterium]|nr:L17 family ribosomal protein [Solirubrobacterales bacterium]
MTAVRLDIEYDGTGFKGWAKQPRQRTVQQELEAALETVLREPVELTVAGRTDTGVHAEGQVASFVTAAEVPANLAQRLNGLGPRDIAVTAAVPTENGFDARRDAAHRESLLSNLSKQLIEHERIKTSQAKAKAVKPEVEQLITLAKR